MVIWALKMIFHLFLLVVLKTNLHVLFKKKQERCFSPPIFVNISLFMKKNLHKDLAEKFQTAKHK